MATLEYIYIEVEDNDNCDYMPMQVYEPQAEPRLIIEVRLKEPDRPHGLYNVIGWSSGGRRHSNGCHVRTGFRLRTSESLPNLWGRLGHTPQTRRAQRGLGY